MATDYHQYDELIDRSFQEKPMTYRDKKKMVGLIDKLETKDHLGILRIIKDSTNKKIYTVNNYGTYIDLDDIDNMTLWKIQYYVSLCMDNLSREKTKNQAEQEHQEQIKKLETDLRNKSKLKLNMTSRTKITPKKKNQQDSDDDSSIEISVPNKLQIDEENDELNLPDVVSHPLEEYDLDQDDFEEDF